jgi:hypothetical protein
MFIIGFCLRTSESRPCYVQLTLRKRPGNAKKSQLNWRLLLSANGGKKFDEEHTTLREQPTEASNDMSSLGEKSAVSTLLGLQRLVPNATRAPTRECLKDELHRNDFGLISSPTSP